MASQGRLKTIVILDRNSGEVQARYGQQSDRNVIAVAASPAFVGALTGTGWATEKPSLEVFEVDSGKSVLKVDAEVNFAVGRTSADSMLKMRGLRGGANRSIAARNALRRTSAEASAHSAQGGARHVSESMPEATT